MSLLILITLVYYYFNYRCPPHKMHQFPVSDVEVIPLGGNYKLEGGIFSNPYPRIISEIWLFMGFNGTLLDVLLDNVIFSVCYGTGWLRTKAMLTIINAGNKNYGNNILIFGNNYGNMTPVILIVMPEGDSS